MLPFASPNVNELLADLRWVRDLARNLARNPHDADDLAQDAVLRALQSPPRHETNVRGWFQRVLGNLARQGRRAEGRRQRREQALALARNDHDERAADDLVERASVHRAVVDALLALEPPYRDTMLLRWFEDRPPREIAIRTGVAVATVHSRLQRGAQLLRTRLDRQFGSHGAWAAACVPLPLALSLPVLGVLVMNAKAVAAGAAVVVGAAVWWGLGAKADPTVPATHPPVAQSSQVPVQADIPGAPIPTAASAARANATPAAVPPAAPTAAAGSRALAGRVVDGDGRAVDGAVLEFGGKTATSNARGEFTFPVALDASGVLRAAGPAWRTVMRAIVNSASTTAPLVVVGPAVDLAGDVRDVDGHAIAGASVRVLWPEDLRSRLADIADTSEEEPVSTVVGPDGAFALATAWTRGAMIFVVADGYVPLRQALPQQHAMAMQLRLERPVAKPGSVQGQVVDARGLPIAGARVGLGKAVVRTDAQGNFVLDDDGKSALLAAAHAGCRRGTVARAAGGFPPFVVVTLGGAPLSIHGRVVDAAGAAVANAKVWATDVTLLCDSREPLAVEGIAAGAVTTSELRERFERGELTDPEQVLRTTATCAWPWVATDADGNFVLTGLDDRAYQVRAMDDATLLRVDTPGIPGGSRGVRIVLPTAATFAVLAGTVVTKSGTPVAGVRLAVQTDTQSMRGFTMHAQAVARTTTDADGRFELRRVPHHDVYLRLDGDNILPLEYGRGEAGGLLGLAAGDSERLRIVVAARMHVQVELLDRLAADSISVLDDSGAPVSLTVFRGRSRNDSETLLLVDGKSPVFVVPDRATTLVLSKDQKEVRREPLQLRAGAVNSLRL